MVFVYGTLKRGFPNHPLLVATATPVVGAATTAGPASMVIGPYSVPFLIPTPSSASSGRVVSGELYAASPAALAEFDAFEASASPPQLDSLSLVHWFGFPPSDLSLQSVAGHPHRCLRAAADHRRGRRVGRGGAGGGVLRAPELRGGALAALRR